jgi:hypothetical protein
MTAPAAMQADYCDLRFIKGRKVIQVVLELPIEAGAQFVSMFGTPDPSKTIPVGIARIDPTAKPERKGGKLAQRAGILCNEGGFAQYCLETLGPSTFGGEMDGKPSEAVYYLCGIRSRIDLDHNEEAARKFHDLELSYNAWKIAA